MAGWVLTSKQTEITLTGGTTYDPVHDTSITHYHRLSFLNQTGGDLKVKVNNALKEEKIVDSSPFDTGPAEQKTPWIDTVTVNGTGSIVVFISYWYYAS